MKLRTYEVLITRVEIYTIKAEHEYEAINLVQQGFGDLYSVDDKGYFEAHIHEEE